MSEDNKASNNDLYITFGAVFCSLVSLFVFFKINYSIENGCKSLRDILEISYFIISIINPFILVYFILKGFSSIKIAFEQIETQKEHFDKQIETQKEHFDKQIEIQKQISEEKNKQLQENFQDQLDLQKKQFLTDNFDKKFFKLLDFYKKSLENVIFTEKEKDNLYLSACQKFNEKAYERTRSYTDINDDLNIDLTISSNTTNIVYKEMILNEIFENQNNLDSISVLSRNFINLIYFIKENKILTEKEKEIEYISILTANFNSEETLLLCYYFILTYQETKLYKILDEYKLLEIAKKSANINEKLLKWYFPNTFKELSTKGEKINLKK